MLSSDLHACLTIADCIDDHRIYDNLKPFRARGGGKIVKEFACDDNEWFRRKKNQPAAVADPTPEPVPELKVKIKRKRNNVGKGHPVRVYNPATGLITDHSAIVFAKASIRFTFSHEVGVLFADKGWARLPRSGIVVWRASMPVPECVPHTSTETPIELNAKEA